MSTKKPTGKQKGSVPKKSCTRMRLVSMSAVATIGWPSARIATPSRFGCFTANLREMAR